MVLLDQGNDGATPLWKKKTFWAGVVTSVLPLYPPIGAWVAANPVAWSALIGMFFGVPMRAVTSAPVKLPLKLK